MKIQLLDAEGKFANEGFLVQPATTLSFEEAPASPFMVKAIAQLDPDGSGTTLVAETSVVPNGTVNIASHALLFGVDSSRLVVSLGILDSDKVTEFDRGAMAGSPKRR